jgi:MFS family permease
MSAGMATPEARSLRELSSEQWRSGCAAWLGWFFDGLDMHLYTLVAAPFVMELVAAASPADPLVREKSSWIQAAFLVGWALGGGFFGRIGDRLGRSRALSLTILTYALFTGLSFFAQTWWQLLIFRFLAALGIGGEWAVGSSLLSETWPRRWRPWIAAVLQAGVNIGILFACWAVYLMASLPPRTVFLVGILPAFLVFWIRRNVPEPAEWREARAGVQAGRGPSVGDLFRGDVLPTTVKIIALCALSLSAWWAFMFWHPQHLRNLPELASWARPDRERLVTKAFFLVVAISLAGNFGAGWMARIFGYRRAIAAMCLGLGLAMLGSFAVPRGHEALVYFWFPLVGFFSGVFGLFTMYLPPLFPTLLRTTGAGFCYNIGRIAAAFGTVFFGLFAQVGDFRHALLYAGVSLLPAAALALVAPELPLD